jgi:hypothetical protein
MREQSLMEIGNFYSKKFNMKETTLSLILAVRTYNSNLPKAERS